MDIITIFITGLFAGGLTCLAVQGGLLASSIAQQEENKLEDQAKQTGHIIPILSFLVTRLVAYTILGLLLGSLGTIFQLSLSARIFLQFAAVVFMVGTALNLLQVHPFFRYFVIQPPRFLSRLVKNQTKSKAVFGPALLGAMTVLIPCGATQAMMAYAISTGSAIAGATTMFAFILGTSPLFFILGYAARKAGGLVSGTFNKVAAAAIILVALYNFNGALALSGSNVTFRSVLTGINCAISFCDEQVVGISTNTVNEVKVLITKNGYTTVPAVVNVKAGSKVKLNIANQGGGGCAQALTIPKLKVQRVVPIGKSDTVEFTAPTTAGPLAFMCSMGMYSGEINVI
jgi:sulfite exporter TauE/SafE